MVKFLVTSERLSIQVHPDDEAARAAGFPRGKEECWLILDAQPGAKLGVGLTAPTTREKLHAAALDGSIVDMIAWRPEHADDFVYNQAGTIPALGQGLTRLDVQTNVDCTSRPFDSVQTPQLPQPCGVAI